MYAQPTKAMTLGTGYSHMRKGRAISRPVFAQVVQRADLSDELNQDPRGEQRGDHRVEIPQRLATIDRPPITSSETCGKRPVGMQPARRR